MVSITIDGQTVQVPAGSTILEAARTANIRIPTLCYHEDQSIKSVCRICAVEVQGQRLLQAACSYPVADGMVVNTATPSVLAARKNNLELLRSHHPQDCLVCGKNGRCELQNLSHELNMNKPLRYPVQSRGFAIDDSSPCITRDPNKCIVCTRCVEACNEVQTVGTFSKEKRGYETVVTTPYGKLTADTPCVGCGQCVQVCPVGALMVHDDTDRFYKALQSDQIIVAQVAPSVRVTIAEALGEEPGAISPGRLVTALKQLGVHQVFDSDFSADLTIMEEGYELLNRLQNGGVLPMITSCCPGWVSFCETFAPNELPHLSSAKSPQQMFGSVIKTYYAQKAGVDPAKICSISIMPCTAKKFECQRPEFFDSGYQDVDFSITVVELADMIRAAGINFATLPETPFDTPFGLGSGAGQIFGATGGVMEAALRTVYEKVTGKTLPRIDFTEVRGGEALKEAVIDMDGMQVKIAVVHSLSNAREMLRKVRAGKADYHFIEVMACPGGCIGGGGTPTPRSWKKIQERMKSIYELDHSLPIRKSHENPAIIEIYDEFLGEPLSEKAHHLLHTSYISRKDLLN